MPLVDMPLNELRNYKGTNPRPVDFDEFWNASLAEMKALDPDISRTPAPFQAPAAECFDLWFTGVGGSRIYSKYLRPKNIKGRIPCVLIFHGYTGGSGDWMSKLPYIHMGMAVAAMDCRGQGGISEDFGRVRGTTYKGHIIRGLSETPDKLLFRQIFLDTAQLAGIVMSFDEIDPGRIAAIGGSQGGGLTVAAAALEPRIVAAAPMYPFLSDYRRVWEMDLTLNAYEELRTYFRNYDPMHENEDEIFYKLGYIDIQNLAKRIKAEVLWGIGLMDTTCPPSTQFAAYNKIESGKQMKIFPDFGHEGLPGFSDMTYTFLADTLL